MSVARLEVTRRDFNVRWIVLGMSMEKFSSTMGYRNLSLFGREVSDYCQEQAINRKRWM